MDIFAGNKDYNNQSLRDAHCTAGVRTVIRPCLLAVKDHAHNGLLVSGLYGQY